MSHAEDVQRNREVWTKANAEYTDAKARESWARTRSTGGCSPARVGDLNALGDVDGKDVVELGCGTAYFGAWLVKRGARVTGVDPTPAQLETAPAHEREFNLPMELIEASAEDVPLPDASFDLAVSEYGASIWADPELWIAEAARLLRPGGRLAFLVNSTCRSSARPMRERSRSGSNAVTQISAGSSGPGRTRASTTTSRTAS